MRFNFVLNNVEYMLKIANKPKYLYANKCKVKRNKNFFDYNNYNYHIRIEK